MVLRLHTTTTCRQLGNDTTYDTEKKNPTSHDVADTSAVSGRRVGKTRRHVFKTNSGRHLKKQHFQLRPSTAVVPAEVAPQQHQTPDRWHPKGCKSSSLDVEGITPSRESTGHHHLLPNQHHFKSYAPLHKNSTDGARS